MRGAAGVVMLATAAVVLALLPVQLPLPPPPAQLPCVPIVQPDCPVPLPPPPDLCLEPPLPPICLPDPPPSDDPPFFTGPLEVVRKGRYVRLTWPPARDDLALAGYRFYRDGNYIGRKGPLIVTVRFIVPCGRHRFRVEAVDSSGQAVSASVRVRRSCD